MQPIPEIDALRLQLKRRHREHLKIELDIAKTFCDLAGVEKYAGRKDDYERTIQHFHQAVDGIRKAMGRVDDLSQDERKGIEAQIAKLEGDLPV